MDRLVRVGLFKNQGYTKTHNLTASQNTKDGRKNWSNLKTEKTNVDYRGQGIFKGMQFVYNEKTGELVVDKINKGTYDYRSPYGGKGSFPYFSHNSYDIEPWIEWGTGGPDVKEDVIMQDELWSKIDSILKDFESNKISKNVAQKKIAAIIPKPPVPPSDMKGGVE